MGIFSCLEKTNHSKKRFYSNYYQVYKSTHLAGNIDISYYETLNAQDLLNADIKKKFDPELLSLWGVLEMRKYVEYENGIVTNPYIPDDQNLTNLPEDTKIPNLLYVDYIKSLSLNGIELKNIYIGIFEIMDLNEFYRPYVILFSKDSIGKFVQIGYGYDTNDNGNVELTISSFNYLIYLTTKGFIESPLSNKKVKLDVYDYIDDKDIGKLLKKI